MLQVKSEIQKAHIEMRQVCPRNYRRTDLQRNGRAENRWPFGSWCHCVNRIKTDISVGRKVSWPGFWKRAYILIPEGRQQFSLRGH